MTNIADGLRIILAVFVIGLLSLMLRLCGKSI